MKKIFAIIAGLIALVSCEFPDGNVYYVKNCGDYLTCKEGSLYNDYGTKLNIVEDQTDKNWAVEGKRMYAVFDILNIEYDVTLKSYLLATSKPLAGQIPDVVQDPADPIDIVDCGLGGYCLNIIFTYYVKEGSETPHSFNLYYKDDNDKLTLSLVHEGAGESPVNYPEDQLKTHTEVYCFPINALVPEGELRTVILEYDYLTKDINDKYVSVHTSKSLYNQQVLF